MSRHLLVLISLLSIPLTASVVHADEDESIRTFLKAYIGAINTRDVDAISTMWAEDAVYADRATGERTEGHDAIVADIKASFAEEGDKPLVSGELERIRVIKSDIATIEGRTSLAYPNEEPVFSFFSALLVKHDDGWKIESLDEMPIPVPVTAYDALRDLEWMVGAWVEQGGDVQVAITMRWAPNRMFLIRSFNVIKQDGAEQLGTQIIGWDPRARQIRSWTFNADGSFGDGLWSKSGEDWLIKSSQTLADGSAASGTYVMTKVDADTLSLKLVGHEIEGEPQPTGKSVTVVRSEETPPVEMPGTEEATTEAGSAED